MGNRSTTVQRVLFGASLTLGVLGVSMPARAYDDGYQNVFSSVLTAVGVLSPDKTPDIDYRERAPLVLPPKIELVKPEKVRARPAAWPRDPDVLARKKADEEARAPVEDGFANSRDHVLSKDELMKGRAKTAGDDYVPDECSGFANNNRHCNVMSPDELRAEGERFQASNPDSSTKDTLTAGVEPERVYLTQPPVGYMKATKTVKATHEAPEPRIDESNPNSSLVVRKTQDDQ